MSWINDAEVAGDLVAVVGLAQRWAARRQRYLKDRIASRACVSVAGASVASIATQSPARGLLRLEACKTAIVASDASSRRAATLASSVANGASSHRPRNGTPAVRAAAATMARWRAIDECRVGDHGVSACRDVTGYLGESCEHRRRLPPRCRRPAAAVLPVRHRAGACGFRRCAAPAHPAPRPVPAPGARARVDLPVPGSPPIAITIGGGGTQIARRRAQIAFRLDGMAAARLDMRAHHGAHRQERRQTARQCGIAGARDVTVEHAVGGTPVHTLVEIHQQEREVVAKIDRRQRSRRTRARRTAPACRATGRDCRDADRRARGGRTRRGRAPAASAAIAVERGTLVANQACTGASASPALRAERTLPSAIQRMVSATATSVTAAAHRERRPPHRRAHPAEPRREPAGAGTGVEKILGRHARHAQHPVHHGEPLPPNDSEPSGRRTTGTTSR